MTQWPTEVKPFEDIWRIEDPDDFAYELSNYISHKHWVRQEHLSKSEYVFDLLASMLSWIEMEGFQDLFYQQYSLEDCILVEKGMREIGADKLADLFAEAKMIYIRRKPNITQEEYEDLDPFDLEMEEGARFDAIADQFLEKGSQIYEFSGRLAEYARKRGSDFLP